MIDAWRTDVPTTERMLELLARWREPWYWRNQWDYREKWNASSIRAQELHFKARELESSGDSGAKALDAIRDCRELAAAIAEKGEPDHQEVLRYAAEWQELEAWLDAHVTDIGEVLPAVDLTDDRPDATRIESAAMQIRRVERDVTRFVQAGHDATPATFAALVQRLRAFADRMDELSPRRLHIRTLDRLQAELVGQVDAGHPDREVIGNIIGVLAQYRVWCGGGGHKLRRYENAPPTGAELRALCGLLARADDKAEAPEAGKRKRRATGKRKRRATRDDTDDRERLKALARRMGNATAKSILISARQDGIRIRRNDALAIIRGTKKSRVAKR